MERAVREGVNDTFVRGRRVCVTGRLASVTHAELACLVRACGGRFLASPPRGSALVVVGEPGSLRRWDAPLTQTLHRARRLHALGYPIRFLSEQEFFERLGLTDPRSAVRGLLTLADLSRTLCVSPVTIRRWMRCGLIEPVKTVYRFCYFDFPQVAAAKRLCRLIGGGVTLAQIRRILAQARRWLPDGEAPLSPLLLLEQDGRPLVRVQGQAIEPNGQRRLEFEVAGDDPGPVLRVDRDVGAEERLFDQALALEDAGQLEEAAQAYRQAIAQAPADPVLHFNLGNVLFAAGAFTEAAESYREALRCDPQYGEAWNNLGSTYVELEAWQRAVDAFRNALRLVPRYPDAQHNLSDTLRRIEWLREVPVESEPSS